MFASLGAAAKLIFDRKVRGLAVFTAVLTLILYAALVAAALWGLNQLPTLGSVWINRFLDLLAPVVLLLLFVFLGAWATALFAPLFLRTAARKIEAQHYPAGPKPSGEGFGATLMAGLRVTALVIIADVLLLPADAVLPGVAEFATIVINGWFLGRGYFEIVALRHMSKSAATALRARHATAVFIAGIAISLLSAIPFADIIAPLFGAGLMVHVFQRYAHEERAA